jgi:hypothetical protein
MGKWLNRIKAAFSWGRFVWFLVGLLGLTGTVTSVGGSTWAVISGVPIPIALMVGFCTLVGAVYLAMAPLAYSALTKENKTVSSVKQNKPEPPNYDAARLLHNYRLGSASRLWCDIDPNEKPTYNSEAWFEVFRSAIQHGKLQFIPRYTAQSYKEKQDPAYDTLVSRDELKRFAASVTQDPRFLRDAD